MSDPLDMEIDGSGSAEGVRTLADQLRSFVETLDGDRRYNLYVRLQEVDGDE